MMTIGNKLVAGIVAGAVVGSAMGLLVAPKTGKESRQTVAEGASHWRNKAGGALQNLRQKPRQESRNGSIKESFNRHLIITK
jgi:gas vesicle protein